MSDDYNERHFLKTECPHFTTQREGSKEKVIRLDNAAAVLTLTIPVTAITIRANTN